MTLLLDENLSPGHAAQLRDAGYDAVAVVEMGLSGAPDEVIRSAAITTGRVLVTLDADFANILRFPPTGTPGVVRLKIDKPTEQEIRAQLLRCLERLRGCDLTGRLAVAHGTVIRIRS